MSRHKLLYVKQINSVLLWNTGNNVQYPVISQMERSMKKTDVCMCTHKYEKYINHLSVCLKLTPRCNPTTLQLFFKRGKKIS